MLERPKLHLGLVDGDTLLRRFAKVTNDFHCLGNGVNIGMMRVASLFGGLKNVCEEQIVSKQPGDRSVDEVVYILPLRSRILETCLQ